MHLPVSVALGIHNPGVFAIGDTIYTGAQRITYPGIPSFSPEVFAYIRNPNPSVYKKFQKVRYFESVCSLARLARGEGRNHFNRISP